MISSKERGKVYVEEPAHGGADDRCAEAVGGGAQGRGRGAGSGRVQAHDLRLESEVRRDGCERGAGSEAVARREHAAAEVSGGSESGQRSLAVGDPKKRLELVARKAAVEQVQEEYAFSERRACGLMAMAVSSYRYQTKPMNRSARGWWSWRGRNRASGIGGCRCCCDAVENTRITSACIGCIGRRD